MPSPITKSLSPEKALIFRILHKRNLPFVLGNGLHCPNSGVTDPNFVGIGSSDLITKRSTHPVPVPPGGPLGDYVPFYFTPYSVMLLNIITGRNVRPIPKSEIAFLVSSLHEVTKLSVPFVFTDRHAYLSRAEYYSDLADLRHVDFELLRTKDFKYDPEDPQKGERYQAEALIYQHLPLEALLGVVCYDKQTVTSVTSELASRELEIKAIDRPSWYF